MFPPPGSHKNDKNKRSRPRDGIKRQKNGNVHVYVYYRCTRKSKAVVCREPHIRAEELDKQLSALLLCYAMPASWADKLRELIDKDEANEKTDFAHRVAGDKKTALACPRKCNGYSIAT